MVEAFHKAYQRAKEHSRDHHPHPTNPDSHVQSEAHLIYSRLQPYEKQRHPADALLLYNYLKQVPLFDELPQYMVQQLCATASVQEISRSRVLFHEGDRGAAVYVILRGETWRTWFG